MNITSNTAISSVEQNGSKEQKAVCYYFDENDNEILDAKEIEKLNASKISVDDNNITIEYQGKKDVYENMSMRHNDSYYKSGYIPVAVLDDYTMGNSGAIDHGYITCNVLKKYNPDLSIDRIETNQTRTYNKFQKFISKQLMKYPKIDEFIYNHNWLNKLIFGKDPNSVAIQQALDELNERIDSGVKYKAVNMSLSYGFEYSEINRLVSKELGTEITPENIADYRKEILEIFESKKDEYIIQNPKDKNSKIKISTLLDMIKSIEKAKIPFYMASTYRSSDNKETWSFLAFAENAITVEAGKVENNGEITHGQRSSHNSLAVKNGKKYIEDSSTIYSGKYLGGGISFATPIALAKDFKTSSCYYSQKNVIFNDINNLLLYQQCMPKMHTKVFSTSTEKTN